MSLDYPDTDPLPPSPNKNAGATPLEITNQFKSIKRLYVELSNCRESNSTMWRICS